MNLASTYTLNDGTKIPVIGFGTNVLKGASGVDAIKTALETGYRLIDTAQSYENEEVIGKAVVESNVKREDLFITTKIRDENQGYQLTIKSLENSLKKLKLDNVDLLLVHWPYLKDFDRSIETWDALIDLQKSGKVKAIGVSNYTPILIQQMSDASGVFPAVNQVEFHPFLFQKELMDYCQEHNIVIESYCPILRAERSDNPVLQLLSEKYNKSPVQIILRWHIEHGLVPIPRSTNPKHIEANTEIFDFSLTGEEIKIIDGLDEDYRLINPQKGPESW